MHLIKTPTFILVAKDDPIIRFKKVFSDKSHYPELHGNRTLAELLRDLIPEGLM